MNYAWEQIGDVLQANQAIRRLHFATAASLRLYARNLLTVASSPSRVLSLTAPVSSRVLLGGATVASLRGSVAAPTLVPPVLTSTAIRRALRPGARLMRSLPFTATATRTNLIQRVNAGEVTSAPPKTVPSGVVTVDQAVSAVIPGNAPACNSGLAQTLSLVAMGGAGHRHRAGNRVVLRAWSCRRNGSSNGCCRRRSIPVPAATPVGDSPASLPKRSRRPDRLLQASPISRPAATSSSAAPGSTFVPTLGGADSPTGTRFNTALAQSFQAEQRWQRGGATSRAGGNQT